MELVSVGLYALGMMGTAGAVIYGSYVGLMWFLDRPFSYRAVMEWVGFVAVMALTSGVASYFMPESWHSILNILLIHFACILAFHIFIFKMEEFLKKYCQYTISRFWLHTMIVVMYAALSVNGIVLTTVHSPLVLRMGQMGIEYLTRTALLFSLLLEIKLRRSGCTDFNELTPPRDDYQNYENQW